MKIKKLRNIVKKQSKKSQVVMEGLVDIMAILFTFLTAVIFFLVFKIEGCGGDENKLIANISGEVKSNNALLSYLRSPVLINNDEAIMSDLIMLFAKDTKNKRYKEDLIKKTNNFLELFSDCAYVKIYDVKKSLIEVGNIACENLNTYEFSCSSMTLPSKKDEERLRVENCISISSTPLNIGVGP